MSYLAKKEYNSQLESLFGDQFYDDNRLFNNINRMLNYFGYDEIVENKSLLDLGSGKSSIVEICKRKNIIAEEINFESNINFTRECTCDYSFINFFIYSKFL